MLEVHSTAAGIRGVAYLPLKSQIIRAAMSIPANIVEGRAQHSERDFSRFVGYAIASASELEYHLIAARDIGAMRATHTEPRIQSAIEVRKMLIGLRNTLLRPATAPPV